jgi:phage terminase large subunit-like protein
MALVFVLLDELHLLGKRAQTSRVLRQIRGGLDKTEEGVLVITTTQSDEAPAGAFKSELKFVRNVRDGLYRSKIIRPTLPLLYELPREMATLTREERRANVEPRWMNPECWPMVMPNINRPITVASMLAEFSSEREKGAEAVQIWASQHLNIEIGTGTTDDGWSGADLWDQQVRKSLDLDELLERSEVVTMGADGGGRDDLLGFSVLGASATRATGCPGPTAGPIRSCSSGARTSPAISRISSTRDRSRSCRSARLMPTCRARKACRRKRPAAGQECGRRRSKPRRGAV